MILSKNSPMTGPCWSWGCLCFFVLLSVPPGISVRSRGGHCHHHNQGGQHHRRLSRYLNRGQGKHPKGLGGITVHLPVQAKVDGHSLRQAVPQNRPASSSRTMVVTIKVPRRARSPSHILICPFLPHRQAGSFSPARPGSHCFFIMAHTPSLPCQGPEGIQGCFVVRRRRGRAEAPPWPQGARGAAVQKVFLPQCR